MASMLLRGGRILALIAAVSLTITVPPLSAAQAKDKDCGWNGNALRLMERADHQVRSPGVTERIKATFGAGVAVKTYTRMEVDLQAAPGATTRPTHAATLTRNYVTYNLQIVQGGAERTASAQVRFDGLCYRTTVVVDAPWVGSTGTDKPLRVNANRALRLAQEYRRMNPDEYPPSEPLHSMNLMQATSAPPDFGKLRWYVNYDNGMGGLRILAVYMDGKVKPV